MATNQTAQLVKAEESKSLLKQDAKGNILDNIQEVRRLLDRDSQRAEFSTALNQKILSLDKFFRLAMTTIAAESRIRICEPLSIVGSLMQCAQLNLVIDGFQGQAYLVPFRNGKESERLKRTVWEAKLMVGYRGLVVLAMRSGKVSNCAASVICEKDAFDYELGSDPYIRHKPNLGDRGKLIGAYAVAYLKDGKPAFDIMSLDDIENIRRRSKNGSDDHGNPAGTWKSDYNEMARKSPMRRLSKWLPLSTEFQLAGVIDEYNERGLDTKVDVETGHVTLIGDGKLEEEKEPIPMPQRESAQITQGEVKVEKAEGATETTEPPVSGNELFPTGKEEKKAPVEGAIDHKQLGKLLAVARSGRFLDIKSDVMEQAIRDYAKVEHLNAILKTQYDDVLAWAGCDKLKVK